MSASSSKTQIFLAGRAFAYLPVYLAAKQKVETHLSDGSTLRWDDAFVIFNTPPKKFLTDRHDDDDRHGDRGCLYAIAKAAQNDQPAIGICDPCEIPVAGLSDELVVVGGLIRHACFWCLADPSMEAADDPRSLQAEHITLHDRAYSNGHYVGKEIARQVAEFHGHNVNEYFGTLGLVVDGALYLVKQNHQRVAAVSASILSTALAHGTGELRYAFPAHNLDRFQNFLTTGLVVSRKFLRDDRFRASVRLLLLGLIFANRYLTASREGSINFILDECRTNNFNDERMLHQAEVHKNIIYRKEKTYLAPLEKVTRSNAEFIYKKLISERNLYSPDCEITEQQWKNGCFGKEREELSDVWPKFEKIVERSILKEAQDEYNSKIALKQDHQQKHKENPFYICVFSIYLLIYTYGYFFVFSIWEEFFVFTSFLAVSILALFKSFPPNMFNLVISNKRRYQVTIALIAVHTLLFVFTFVIIILSSMAGDYNGSCYAPSNYDVLNRLFYFCSCASEKYLGPFLYALGAIQTGLGLISYPYIKQESRTSGRLSWLSRLLTRDG